jgi:PAS domain S-box-containing protein
MAAESKSTVAAADERRVLVVDDDQDLAESLVELLRLRGYAARAAGSIAEALRVAADMRPDVVLVDLRLGQANGIDLIAALRQRDPDALCVIITAYADTETAIDALQRGAYDYLRKPLGGDELLALLGRAFETLRLRRERSQALEALRASEAHLRRAAQLVRMGYICADGSTGQVVWSDEAYRLFGYEPGEVPATGALFEQHLDAGDRARVMAELRRCAREGVEFQAEFCCLNRAGHRWFAHARGQAVADAAGHLVGLDGILQDVSEQKQAAARHARLEEQLRQAQKMEAIACLAGGIAHDFSNLLLVILAHAEMLRTDVEAGHCEGERVLAALDPIERAGERARVLTRQLLTFSRQQPTKLERLDPNSLLVDMEDMVCRLVGEDVRIRFDLQADVPWIRVDAGQFGQVIMNMVVNARDAMPAGGTLDISTSAVELDAEFCAARPDLTAGPYVVITLTDSGCGMDPATVERAFEPFFTTKPVGKGTGLGLSTVYAIVRQSGGHIDTASRVGHGTTFKVFFPAVAAGAPAAAPAPAETRPMGGGETILVCEDDEAVRALAAGTLRRAGYTVMEANCGERAIEIASSYAGLIHMLVTDVVLPGLNGRQVAGKLRAKRPGLRVLFVSGYTADTISEHGVSVGGNDLMYKPFGMRALVERVRQILGRTEVQVERARGRLEGGPDHD